MRRRLRSVVLVLSLAATGLMLYLWISCPWWSHHLTHTRVTCREDGAVAEGAMGRWVIEHRTHSIGGEPGRLGWVGATYLSLMEQEPSAEELATRRRSAGWEVHRTPSVRRGGTVDPGWYWRGPRDWRALGFGVFSGAGGGGTYNAAEAPLWFWTLLSAWPAIWIGLRARRRASRLRRHQCVRCGYDVSGAMLVCPECGAELAGARARGGGG